MRSPRVVVFDFNGVLLNDLCVAYGSVQEIFKTYDIPCPTLEQFREEITAEFMEFYFQHGFSRPTAKDELEKLRDDLQTIRRIFYRANEGNACIRSDVSNMVRWLLARNFYVAIVSAERRTTLHKYLVKDGLQRQFDCIISGAWGDGAKEKALIDAAEIFEVRPGNMIYVDDTVDGLRAAGNAGVVPVAFTNMTGYNSSHKLMEVTDININEISGLKELIRY